jgi:hypothetical protein
VKTYLFQGFVGGGDLSNHVAAIAFFTEHLLNSANLAFNTAESFLQVVGGFSWYLHVLTIYP